MKRRWLFLVLFVLPLVNMANGTVIRAVFTSEPIRIDGELRENIWKNQGTGDFRQIIPDPGKPATEKTMVWVAYTRNALFIAAMCYDSEPENIRARLSRRDEHNESDWFYFAVDSLNTQNKGYQFGVNPAGSIEDMALYNDIRTDLNWDGIWEYQASINPQGWSVEMKIPFDQFQYSTENIQEWRVNFRRIIQRKKEEVIWAWKPREQQGYVSHFQPLSGLKNLQHQKIMESIPYLVLEGNPLVTDRPGKIRAGLDNKWKINSNLFLDLTLNPDFGQIEADPAVINLTALETYYDEKRPFFINGMDYFRFGSGGTPYQTALGFNTPIFYYSRRIGDYPSLMLSGSPSQFERVPIIGAVKITGSLTGGWNIGAVSSITGRKTGFSELNENKIEVEPLTFYNLIRFQKESQGGFSGQGIILGTVLRDFTADQTLNLLPRYSLSLGWDGWTFLNSDKSWVINSWIGTTSVHGSVQAMDKLQRSYLHYFQRPDAKTSRYDSDRRNLNGLGGRVYLAKLGGHLVFNSSLGFISPGFEINDLGYQSSRDLINGHFQFGYDSVNPTRHLRHWHMVGSYARSYNFDGNKTGDLLFLDSGLTLNNYWQLNLTTQYGFERFSDTLTRGGPLVIEAPFYAFNLNINSDNGKSLVLTADADYLHRETGDQNYTFAPGFILTVSDKFNIQFEPFYTYNNNLNQWVTNLPDSTATETFETRYIFGALKQKTVGCSIRLNWTINPVLSIQGYFQPLLSAGDYQGFKYLSRPGTGDFTRLPEADPQSGYYHVGLSESHQISFPDPDFNQGFFRGTLVIRWEYRAGSTLFFIWSNNVNVDNGQIPFDLQNNWSNLLSGRGEHSFAMKVTYRL